MLGVGISPINLDKASEIMHSAIRSKLQGYVGVTGVHGVIEAQSDPSFKGILNNTFLNTPDGMPMVWYGKILGYEGISRVYGPDLMLSLIHI